MTPKKLINKPTLIVDTREKTPWNFEGDDSFEEVVYEKLDGGDYSIQGLEDFITIERKASVDELFVNFTKDKKRIRAEFDRLKDHKLKFIIVEETCEGILNPDKYYVNKRRINKQSPMMPVAVVSGALTELMITDNVQVIFAGEKAQSMAKHILLKTYELFQRGKL